MGFDKKNKLNFEEILNRMKEILGVENDKDVAMAINIKPNAFYNRKKSGSIPLSEFVGLAITHKVCLDWLIRGDGPKFIADDTDSCVCHSETPEYKTKPASKKTQSKNENKIVTEHQQIIREFPDPAEGLQMNKNLVKIGKKSRQALRDMGKYIEGVAKGIDYLQEDEKESTQPGAGQDQFENNQKKTV